MHKAGSFTLSITADPDQVVEESLESDNTLIIPFIVQERSESAQKTFYIEKISGPQSIPVKEIGTWQIQVNTKQGHEFSYGVLWSDEPNYPYTMPETRATSASTATFSHAFNEAITYTIIVK